MIRGHVTELIVIIDVESYDFYCATCFSSENNNLFTNKQTYLILSIRQLYMVI